MKRYLLRVLVEVIDDDALGEIISGINSRKCFPIFEVNGYGAQIVAVAEGDHNA